MLQRIYILYLLGSSLGASFLWAEAATNTNARNVRPPQARQDTGTSIPVAELNALLSRAYEERGRAALERYVPNREFELTAVAQASNRPLKSAPYEPRSITAGTLGRMPIEELSTYTSRVNITLSLSKRLGSSRRKLEEILNRTLLLSANRGDRVQVTSLGIELDNEDWTKEKIELRAQLEALRVENAKLNRELATEQTKAQAIQRDIEEMRAKNAAEDASQPTFTEEFKWWIAGSMIAFLFILLAGFVLFSSSLSRTSRNLGGAITNIAQSMESLGGALQSTPKVIDAGGARTLEGKLISEGRSGGGSSNLLQLPMETVESHILKNRTELLSNMNEAGEALILRYLNQLCGTPQTVSRAVVALEFLGKEIASQFFQRLSVEAQEAILSFMREGAYDKNKLELMLEVGEDLKTRLLVESFNRVRGKSTEKLAARVIQLTDDDLVRVTKEADPGLLARLFLFVEPARIASLMKTLKQNNPGALELIVATLPKLPEVETDESQDQNLIALIEQFVSESQSDKTRSYLKVYQEIVEASDEDLGETIVKELSQDARLDSFFKTNIVNIQTFFKLNEETQEELLEALPNRDIAAFAFGVDETQREIVFNLVPARRRALVDEEFDTLSSRNAKQADQAFKRVRETIVKRLKEMNQQGVLKGSLADTPQNNRVA